MVDSLTIENKTLSTQVLTLKEKVGHLTKRQLQAQAQIAQQQQQQFQHKNGYNTSTSCNMTHQM